MEYDNRNIEDVLNREAYKDALTSGSLAANVTVGLGALLGSPINSIIHTAAIFGGFTYGTSLMQHAGIFEQKIIGAGIAAATFLPAYKAVVEATPLVYGKIYAGIELIKSGAYAAAAQPIATVLVGAVLGYLLIAGIQKAIRNIFSKGKKKKKK